MYKFTHLPPEAVYCTFSILMGLKAISYD